MSICSPTFFEDNIPFPLVVICLYSCNIWHININSF
uniref:Uncharacterized protein n=1 Tax=Rhizophora mucronata TaxID=61149 RepID=A0A2P2PHE9_RHIMU